jgi:hypothetical protein
MAVCVLGIQHAIPADWPLAIRLTIEILIGGGVYAMSVQLFHRQRLVMLFQLIRESRKE